MLATGRARSELVPRGFDEPVGDATREAPAWWAECAWVAAAAAIGAAATLVDSSWLGLRRTWHVALVIMLVAALTRAYLAWSGIQAASLVRRRWVWAGARGVLLGLLLIAFALPEDETAPVTGGRLVFAIVWLGVGYGVAEALLLNVLPMTAIWRAATRLGWTATTRGKIGASVLSLFANLLVTSAYHLGFPEFRGREIAGPIGGNLMIGLGYLLAPNPITTLLGHVILHVAAVLGGENGTYQLPPH